MNPVELYKKLIRTNCGECRQKAAISFAFALLKGDAELTERSFLAPDLRSDIGFLLRNAFDARTLYQT